VTGGGKNVIETLLMRNFPKDLPVDPGRIDISNNRLVAMPHVPEYDGCANSRKFVAPGPFVDEALSTGMHV
jgi:hypothetical protein